MLFNSIEFVIFLPIVFFIYWFVINKNLKQQNFFLLFASYVFYGWWDWRFLSLIFFSSIVDFVVGKNLAKHTNPVKRKMLLYTSIIVNIGFLGIFKYYNFFAESLVNAFSFFGTHLNISSLNVILPVGISFYTFQTLSYTIDVYNKKLEPTRDIVAFFAFVSFFPQLVAGPIERAKNLLPQFYKHRTFEYSKATDGLRQILWGLFKKIVIADNCAVFVNQVFGNHHNYSASTLVLAVVFFAFQIYGDFSGYSDIAIGTARLFGFSLMRNFAFPYFSRDIAEFWRRWHISLSTWFRDYVYIPLGGSRGGTSSKIRNTFIIFIVSGFWHGANWTFIVWGFLNALYYVPLMIMQKNRTNLNAVAENKILPNLTEFLQITLTFCLTLFAWIFFRANNLSHAFSYISSICSTSLFSMPNIPSKSIFVFLLILVAFEWIHRDKQHALQFNKKLPIAINWSIYYTILVIIFLFGGQQQQFIYFQF